MFFTSLLYGQKNTSSASDGNYYDATKLQNQIALESNSTSDKYPANFENNALFLKLYGAEGPYSFANPNAEILALRDESSKHFLNKDGKITSVLSAGQVHYLENGIWKTILNDFHPVSKAGYTYGSEYNAFKTYMGNTLNQGLEVIYSDGRKLNLMQGTYIVGLDANKNEIANSRIDLTGQIADVQNEFLKYAQVSNGIDAIFQKNSVGYKVDYEIQALNNLPTLSNQTEYIAFVEKIHFDHANYMYFIDNGSISFENTQKQVVLTYDKPVVYPKLFKNVNSLNLTEEYIVKQVGNDFYVYILIKKEWLTNPDFVFPIIVDPTVTLIPNNAVAWTYTVQEDGDCEQDDNMKVGFFDGTFGNDLYQCYSKFNTSSIPDANCIQSAYVNYYQHHFENDQSNDNVLDFYFQALDPYNTDPVTTSCAADATNINATTTWYRKYNVFGNCGGTCTDYNESNGWKNFPDNVGARVQLGLVQDFIAFSIDNITSGHSDPSLGCGFLGLGVCDNDDYLEFRGHSNANRPTLVVTHEAPSVAATSINVTPSNTICNGTSVTMSVVGGSLGGGATWNWYSGSCGGTLVGTGTSITVTPAVTTTYYVRAQGICNTTVCVSTTINVNTASTAPTAITGTNTICTGGTTTLTVTGGALGTGASYQWYSGSCGGASVGSGTSITVSPAVTTTYYVRAEGLCATTACVSRTVTVETLSTAPGSITASLTTVCAGTATTLSVNGGSLGTGAVWNWYSGSCGGTLVGTGSSINVSPNSNTTYYVRAQGNCNTTACASIAITVNSLSVAPTGITSVSDTLCLGNSVILSVAGGSLGTGATWQWYTNTCGGVSVGSGNSISVSPTVNTVYFVRAEGTCNTTLCMAKTITVAPIPLAPIVNDVEECADVPITLTATGNGGTIKWYLTNVSTPEIATGNTLSLGLLTAGTYFRYFTETNAYGCESLRGSVEIIIKPLPSNAPDAIGATICPGDFASLLATNPISALVPASNFNWYSISSPTVIYTGAIFNTPNLSSPPATHIYIVAGVLDGCEGAPTLVNVDFYNAAQPIASNDTSICTGNSVTLSASAVGSTEIRWYTNSDLTGYLQSGSSFTTPILNANTTYYVSAVYPNGCESLSEPIVISINPLALSPILTDEIYCTSDNIILNATNISGTLTWYSDAALTTSVGTGSPLNLGIQPAGVYNYFAQVNNGTCTSLAIANTVEVIANPVALGIVPQTICEGESASLTTTSTNNVNWYADAALSNLLFVGSTFTTPILTSNTTYYVTQSTTLCESVSSSVLVTVNAKPTAPSTTDEVVCKNESATLIASGTGTFTWYSDAALTNVLFVGSTFVTPNLNANTTYYVTVNNGLCESEASAVNVTVNLDIVIAIDSIINVLCSGTNSGAVYTSVSGGDGTYTYLWSNAGSAQDLLNVSAGNYTLLVTDGLGCSASANASVSSPTALSINLDNLENVSCNGLVDGSINVSIAGGTSAYTYEWENATSVIATTQDLLNVGAGFYTLTVTDANNCTATYSATVSENAALTGSIIKNNVLCYGGTSNASVNVNGGALPYTYLWSNFDNTNNTTGLSAGAVSVIVTDFNGCTLQLFDTITAPTAPLEVLLTSIEHVTCFNGTDGAIQTQVIGGTPPYIITWSPNGETTTAINNLSAGTYTISVRDANACTVEVSYTINNALEIISTMAVTNPACYGEETGMIVVGNSGGTAPYSYAWNTTPPQSGVIALNLAGNANYTVTITDANGCESQNTATVVYPDEIIVNTIPTSVSCISAANGSVTVEVQNGFYPYQYQLNGFLQADSVFENLAGGNYVVFVEDNHNCTASASFTINTVSGMEALLEGAGNDMNFVSDNLFIVRGEEVHLNVELINDNGNPIVAYQWNPNSIDPTSSLNNPTFSPIENVVVVVEVLEDINGTTCSVFDTLSIQVSQEKLVFVPTAFSPNNSGANNFFELNILGAKNLDVKIFNRWGELIFSNPNQANGPNDGNDPSLTDGTNPRNAWDGKYLGEDVPTGAYAYQIEVTYFDDTKEVISGSVTVIR